MVSRGSSAFCARWGAAVALGGLLVLGFGELLVYYGDQHAREYRWKGPAAAVVIAIVSGALVVAVRHLPLRGWMRLVGHLALGGLVTFLAFQAAATYYTERCQDPAHVGACGLPVLAAMLWAAVAAAVWALLAVAVELSGRRRGSG